MQFEIRKTVKSNIVNFSKLKYGFDPQLWEWFHFGFHKMFCFNLILIFLKKMCFIVIVVN